MVIGDDFYKRQQAYLVWLLARRDYSRFQLEQKLKKRDVSAAEISSLLEGLIEQGYFHEQSYKMVRIRSLVRRGFGPRYIQSKLREQKIRPTDEDFTEAFQQLNQAPDEGLDSVILKLLAKLKSRNLDPKILESRLVKNLMAKGHAPHKVLERYRRIKDENAEAGKDK